MVSDTASTISLQNKMIVYTAGGDRTARKRLS